MHSPEEKEPTKGIVTLQLLLKHAGQLACSPLTCLVIRRCCWSLFSKPVRLGWTHNASRVRSLGSVLTHRKSCWRLWWNTDSLDFLSPNSPNGGLSTLTHLILGDRFTQGSLDHLPNTLRHLDLSRCYHWNQRLDWLPPDLHTLKLGYHFNQPLDWLPSALNTLIIGTCSVAGRRSSCFNQHLDHLPPALRNLSTRSLSFDHFPPDLEQLNIDLDEDDYPSLSVHQLPTRLRHLTLFIKMRFYSSFSDISLDHLPPDLQTLEVKVISYRSLFRRTVSMILDHLPLTLSQLTLINLDDYDDETIIFEANLDHLPPSLIDLRVKDFFLRSLDGLPSALQNLDFCCSLPNLTLNFDHLPPTLCTLRLAVDNLTNHPSLDHLPSHLLRLELDLPHYHALDHLPSTLWFLDFKLLRRYSKPLHWLPSGLRVLHLRNGSGDLPSVDGVLPDSLVTLSLPEYYTHTLLHPPSSLRHLRVSQIASWRPPPELVSLSLGKGFNDTCIFEPGYLPSSLRKLSLSSGHSFLNENLFFPVAFNPLNPSH